MNPETLLGLISGGRYGTSADLPTIPEMAHSYIDQIKDTYDQQQQIDMQIQGQGLGLLDMVGGVAKAGALIPTFTRKYAKSKFGQSLIDDMIKRVRMEGAMAVPGSKKGTVDWLLSKNPKLHSSEIKGYAKAQSAEEVLAKERMMLQVYGKALEQFNKFGAARPGTESFIQRLLKQLNIDK